MKKCKIMGGIEFFLRGGGENERYSGDAARDSRTIHAMKFLILYIYIYFLYSLNFSLSIKFQSKYSYDTKRRKNKFLHSAYPKTQRRRKWNVYLQG